LYYRPMGSCLMRKVTSPHLISTILKVKYAFIEGMDAATDEVLYSNQRKLQV
jgi:hypothetical protein